MRIKRWNWLPVLLAMVLMVSGCGIFGKKEKASENYKRATVGANLEVPPDLTSVAPDRAYTIPKANTVTPLAAPGTPKAETNSAGAAVDTSANVEQNLKDTGRGLLPEFSKAYIERDGALRWLVVEQSPEKLWKPISDFWLNDGIGLAIQNDQTGVIETQWIEYEQVVESQAGVQGWVQRMFTGGANSGTPERDKFRVRLERGVKANTTEIYVTHQRMVLVGALSPEDLVENDRTTSNNPARWVVQPYNPDVEVEVLRLIMVYLGVDKKTATRVIASAPVLPPDRARLVSGTQRAQQLEMDFEFNRAWRRVGVALDRLGFTIEDRNSREGVYTIRTVEPGVVERKKKNEGFFRKMFSSKEIAPIEVTNLIKVASSNKLATVQVLSKEGVVDQSANSARILRLLYEQLR